MPKRRLSYAEIADEIAALPQVTRDTRELRRLNLRDAADQIGIGFNSLSRFERGQDLYASNLIAVLHWLSGTMKAAPATPEVPDA